MNIFSVQAINAVLDKDEVIQAVKQSFIEKEQGLATCPSPMQILFNNDENQLVADCHVKAAQNKNSDFFVIKVASGFYENKHKGLPVNNGMSLLMSASTGAPVALFQDEGLLTSMRTAAAGAISTALAQHINENSVLGVIGTGHQALLQAQWVCHLTGIRKVVVQGRNYQSALGFAEAFPLAHVECWAVHDNKELAVLSDAIVTTTPATAPLISLNDIKKPMHIVAMGADSPGKQELDPELLEAAEVIVTDDHHQCLAHGEFGIACRAGLINEQTDVALGKVLAKPSENKISGTGISIVDLTGVGTQDLAIASYVWRKLSRHHT